MNDNIKMIDIDNFKCNYCTKKLKNFRTLQRHCRTSKTHLKNITEYGIKESDRKIKQYESTLSERNRTERNYKVIYEDDICKIPLSNGTYVKVDIFIYKKIKNYSLSPNDESKYVTINVNNKKILLHRYIYYILFHRAPRPGYMIDHENRNRLDATVENLREVLPDVNSRNTSKSDNCSSIYKGVHKREGGWQCQLKIDGTAKGKTFCYIDELHAAYHYNLLVIEANIDAPLNDVVKPEDFILRVHRVRNNDLPLGISKANQKFRYKLHGIHSHVFDTVEEAVNERNQRIEDEIVETRNKLLTDPIKRNGEGIPIIEFFNDDKEKIFEITVDAHRYHEIILNYVSLRKGYINITIDNKTTCLSRYLLNCTDIRKCVDHKNNDTTNYQMNNLRVVSYLQNAQNKTAIPGSSSKYIGVTKPKNRNK